MRKKLHIINLIALALAFIMLVVCLSTIKQSSNTQTLSASKISSERKISINDRVDELDLKSKLDYYEFDKEQLHISAYNYEEKECLSDKVDVNMIESDKIRFAYDAEYVESENLIYLAVSVFDEYDKLLDVTTMTAEPIYYEDGTRDALFSIEDKEVYLSELLQCETENCFFFSALFSVLSATIVTAIVKTIVISTVVVVSVAVVGYATYELVTVTKDWIKEKERETQDKKRKNPIEPSIYYYARSSGDKLIISAVPDGLSVASKNMRYYVSSYWTPMPSDAFILVNAAGGAMSRYPEIDKTWNGRPLKGYYWHYHCVNGAHAWYGYPSGNKF